MNATQIFDAVGSFIEGFGRKDEIDINNAIFIAKRLLDFDIPLDFEDGGGFGIESLELYGMFDEIPERKEGRDKRAYEIGEKLSKLSSNELRLIASYLWNKGRSSLFPEEREEAAQLLENFQQDIDSKIPTTEPSFAAAAS